MLMTKYTDADLLRLAKRINNNKRIYLLINPLQAKHVPVNPTLSFQMMEQLGHNVAKAYPNTRLVIGFAETATAIGAVVANCIAPDCNYIHTTRENLQEENDWVNFVEEHSHMLQSRNSLQVVLPLCLP